ncbi:DEAD/DEAH box helicase [Gammaproteobacteria bacterium 42_54_T18]|nr:DEAD/DEAH box helicase [Gammaproteobacteria bacterium 42_54_T18]
MKLRQWQAECIDKALEQYRSGNTHFMCLATPGAGKTMMASTLAKKLLEIGNIDLVICLSPSVIVSEDFQSELEVQTGKRLDGKLGSNGCSLTYQAMLSLGSDFWALLSEFRVFVIFDEIHHCAGSGAQNANAWGERIISQIQGKAAFTLALTGTPWRSDSIPIVLARYCESKRIRCDYSYGLSKAISEGVCRTPRLTLIDNDQIIFKQGNERCFYGSFCELLEQADCSYQNLVENEDLVAYMIGKANKKLNQLRMHVPDAGGLIVATSVAHARQIHGLLETRFNEVADIATYLEDDAISIIQNYKQSSTKWIISVGMISEGTNLPRLHVCCHLTRVKTELYFRQILGRILRVNDPVAGEGFLYMPAEPTLSEFAHRVAEDIPKENVVSFDSMPNPKSGEPKSSAKVLELDSPLELSLSDFTNHESKSDTLACGDSLLARSYEATLNIPGRFKSEVLSFTGTVFA